MLLITDFVGQTKAGYGFSIDKKRTADKLRELADKIENSITNFSDNPTKPDFILQGVTLKAEGSIDDFCITELTLRIAEQRNGSTVPKV